MTCSIVDTDGTDLKKKKKDNRDEKQAVLMFWGLSISMVLIELWGHCEVQMS